MDSLVNNDTRDLHWLLEFEESSHLLRALFPDHELFQKSMESPLTSSHTVLGQSPLNLFQVLEMLRKKKYYHQEIVNVMVFPVDYGKHMST